ncbi:hypothetical protein GCM10009795_096680 [Nocardioides hankookensis]|uniref:Uncharacterized protein n=1 Tax=Nocardioides hankookensis TaxID=443157 RepID=A0ABW1LM92_9ACTN
MRPTGNSQATSSDSTRAASVWARLAPRLAARGRVRISRDGGRNYPRKYERFASAELPNTPAAVRVYDVNGCAPVFVVDLDSAKSSASQVERDFDALIGLLERTGLRSWFSDHSPNGGRHVYVPLTEPAPFEEVRAAARLLAGRLRTVDPLPLASIDSGCIRPPGARHKSGGHQVLDGPVEHAEAALDAPNDTRAWQRFRAELSRHTAPLASPASGSSMSSGSTTADPEGRLPALPGHLKPSEAFQTIARTGEYPTTRYASPSEARQAVLWAAVAAGWSFVDVARRVEDGTWAGLASFYARYRPHQRHNALSRDWRKAYMFETRRREAHEKTSVRLRPTSPQKSHGAEGSSPVPVGSVQVAGRGDASARVREWLAAVDLLHGSDSDLGVRAVLYALAEAAVLTGSLTVEHGNRALAIGTGLHERSVGRALQVLLDEPPDRALIDLVRPARGVRANAYELRIPALLVPACEAKPWRAGRVHAIRPVFRELGLAAAFVYAALEREQAGQNSSGDTSAPIGGRELAAKARVGVTATYDALATLAAHGLAERAPAGSDGPGGWILGTASLTQLAEAWGIADTIRAQIERYRAERRAWRRWLVEHGLLDPQFVDATRAPPPPPPRTAPQRPPGLPERPFLVPAAAGGTPWADDEAGMLAFLERELGAHQLTPGNGSAVS